MEKEQEQPSEKQTLEGVSSAILQEPIVLEVDIRPRHLIHRFLQGRGWAPKKRQLTIAPITLGNLIRISKILLAIDTSFDMDKIMDSNYRLLRDHGDQMARIIAIAIHNKRSDPPASLVSFISGNFTGPELLKTVKVVLKQMDLTSFMNTIISVKGLTVMSPKVQGS